MNNSQKFLVSWITADQQTFGQAVKTEDDAVRMYDHLINTDALYVEVRHIKHVATVRRRRLQFHRSMETDNVIKMRKPDNVFDPS